MNVSKLVPLLNLVAAVGLLSRTACAAPDTLADDPVPLALSTKIAAGHWKSVADLPVVGVKDTTVLRLLKAHGCLALNRNDEGLKLITTVGSDEDRRAWDRWTAGFLTEHPDNATASYLRADALLRSNQWDAARDLLTAALSTKQNGKDPYLLNLRGVVNIQRGEWYAAISDLEGAVKAKPDYAEAYANRGLLNLQKKAGAKGAVEWLDKALKASPNFSLARYNRGFALIVAGVSKDGPAELLAAAAQMPFLAPSFAEDRDRIAQWLHDRGAARDGDGKIADIGTHLDLIIGRVSGGDVGALNEAAKILGDTANAKFIPSFVRNLQQIARQNPVLGQRITEKISSGVSWNAPTGTAQQIVSVVRGTKASISAGVGVKSVTDSTGIGAKTASSSAELKGGVTTDLNGLGKIQKNITTNNYNGFKAMQSSGLGQNEGGVSSSLENVPIDDGDWPFNPHDSLCYWKNVGAPEAK